MQISDWTFATDLLIRPATPADESDLGLLYREEDFKRRIGGNAREDANSMFNPLQFGVLVLHALPEDQFVGICSLRRTQSDEFDRSQRVELSVGILKGEWRKGYATAAVCAIGRRFRSLFPGEPLVARFDSDNIAIKELLKKIGHDFERESGHV